MKSKLEIEEEEKQPLMNNAEAVTVQQELPSIHNGNLTESELNNPSDDNLTSEGEGEGAAAAAAGLAILISNGNTQTPNISSDSIEETNPNSQEDLNLNAKENQETVNEQDNEAHPGAVAAIWRFLCLLSSMIFMMLLVCALKELIVPKGASPSVRCPSMKGPWVLIPISGFLVGIPMHFQILSMVERMKERGSSKLFCILKTVITFVLSMWAAWHLREYHKNTPDLLTASWETGLPLSLGVVLSATLGLMLQGDITEIFETVVSGLQIYTTLWITYNRAEAYYLFFIFLLLCLACYWSEFIIHAAYLSWKYTKSCVTRRCHILHDTIAEAWQGTVLNEVCSSFFR